MSVVSRFRVAPTAWIHLTTVCGVLCSAACAPASTSLPTTPPAPVVLPPTTPTARPTSRVALPARLPATNWRITATTRLSGSVPSSPPAASGTTDSATDQQVVTQAQVSLMFDRTSNGGLRGTGHVDSFTVRSTMDDRRPQDMRVTRPGQNAPRLAPPERLLIDALLDSTVARVVIRPALGNECDRPEMSAVQLVRELLVRVPDGVAVGDQWRDSTVALVCRSGVPITVFTNVRSTLTQIDGEAITVQRHVTSRLTGSGGSAFRALEVSGVSTGMQTAVISATRGTLDQLRGTSTTTLTVSERASPNPPRVQQVTQRVDLRVERIDR